MKDEIARMYTPSLKKHQRLVVEDFSRDKGTNMFGEANEVCVMYVCVCVCV